MQRGNGLGFGYLIALQRCQNLRDHLGRLQNAPDLGDDGVLDHARRQVGRCLIAATVVLRGAVLDHVHRHVIAVELAAFLRRDQCHGRAGVGEDQAIQRRWRLHAAVAGPRVAVALQDGVDLIPDIVGDDALVFARISLTLVAGLAVIDAIPEYSIEVALVDQRPLLAAKPFPPQFLGQQRG